jgi:hypothetical protein
MWRKRQLSRTRPSGIIQGVPLSAILTGGRLSRGVCKCNGCICWNGDAGRSVAGIRALAGIGKATAFSSSAVGRRVARDLQTAEPTAPINSGDGVPECESTAVWIPSSLQMPIVCGVDGRRLSKQHSDR